MSKKKLNLEVKTLETKVAPGACYQTHVAAYGTSAQSQQAWVNATHADPNQQYDPMDPRSWSGNQTNSNGGGAGVPVIGIN